MTVSLIRGLLILLVAASCAGFSASAGSAVAAEPLEVRIGIDGHYRIGRWMPVRVVGAEAAERLEIETLDGDGVRLVQTAPVPAEGEAAAADGFYRYVPAGPQGAPLEVRSLRDAEQQGETPQGSVEGVWRTRLIEGAVPIARPWVVAIGDPLGLDTLGANELLGIPASVDVSLITEAADAPDAWYGYDGVDLMLVGAAGRETLEAMSPQQGRAIVQWVRGGGRMLLTLGERGPETLEAAAWLRELTGIEGRPAVVPADPVAIESFIVARDPIRSFNTSRLPTDIGTVVLAGRSNDRRSLPLVINRHVGFGTVTIVAADLESPPFAEWSQREDLVTRLLPGLVEDRRSRGGAPSGSEVRYSELAGQIRATLDRFAGAERAQFSLIAAILLAVVGLIGPLDYFLVNRWLHRPWLGWITFPLSICAFSAAILFWRGSIAERGVRQIAVVDIDPASGRGRGFAWSQVFSGDADRLNMSIIADRDLGGGPTVTTLTSPWGYAGEVFGGIEVAGEDVRLPAYAMQQEQQEQRADGTTLVDVPLAPLSSKGILGRWRFDTEVESTSTLRRQPGSDLLSGVLVNPLPVDVLDGLLIYRNTVFTLPTRIPAGARVGAVETLQAKNFRWRLNRRQTGEQSSQSEPWDKAEDDDLTRLMEIVLFYRAAGGKTYTELSNRTLADLDLSHALTPDRAILVGRLRDPVARVQLDGRTPDDAQIEEATYVRVMLPVETSLANP